MMSGWAMTGGIFSVVILYMYFFLSVIEDGWFYLLGKAILYLVLLSGAVAVVYSIFRFFRYLITGE